MKSIALLIIAIAASVLAEVKCEDFEAEFNQYIGEEAPFYKWHYTGNSFYTLTGGRVHVLNVTTIKWLDESVYEVKGGSPLWTHEVAVVVPRQLKYTNVSSIYMASAFYRCNTDEPLKMTTFDLEIADLIANDIQSIVVVSFQTPNCPLVFKDDPHQMERTEDSLVAWTLKEFHDKSDHLPERIVMYPMAKAALL